MRTPQRAPQPAPRLESSWEWWVSGLSAPCGQVMTAWSTILTRPSASALLRSVAACFAPSGSSNFHTVKVVIIHSSLSTAGHSGAGGWFSR